MKKKISKILNAGNPIFGKSSSTCSSSSFKKKNDNLFKGRNIIKKVKTHSLKIFFALLKNLLKVKKKPNSKSKENLCSSNHQKSKIMRIFKSDISKLRNKILLEMPMLQLISLFTNINIQFLKIKLNEDKIYKLNFLLNSTWKDFLLLIIHRSKEIFCSSNYTMKLSIQDVKDYLDYIQHSKKMYKNRVKLDKEYCELFRDLKQNENEKNEKNGNNTPQIIESVNNLGVQNFIFCVTSRTLKSN